MNRLDAEQPHRFFFVHIPKTGGSTLRRRLIHHFGETAVYPTGLDGTDPLRPYLFVDHLLERLAARGDQIRVITGHFPLCTTELIDGRLTTLTLLRDPVDRTLSYLRYRREGEGPDQGKALGEIYEAAAPFRKLASNHMTRLLSFTRAEMAQMSKLFSRTLAGKATPNAASVEPDRDHLERAKQRIAELDAVGLQEDFEDFCDELGARFGWDLGEPVRVNTTAPVEASDGLRARIADDNPFDVELYEFTKRLLLDRRQSADDRAASGMRR
jgi:Sulfotransferase family